jgi:peptide/nickel transport system substrate-binding protein
MDVSPVIQDGRTLVPMRAIFEALGAQVYWDNPDIVRSYRREDVLVLQLGSRIAWVNGPSRQLDVAPIAISGRTMIPLRFVAEALGAKVEWIESTRTVTVQYTPYTPPLVGGTLTYASTADPLMLNPILSEDGASAAIHTLTNWGLVRVGTELAPRNSIADRWSWDQANLTWTFWLRPDVRFSDGRPLTARDVKFTFDTILHPEYDGPLRTAVQHIAEITAAGDRVVRFRMRQVDASFLISIGFGILPQHILGNVPVREHRTHGFSRQPVGAGSYLLDRIILGQQTVLRRNPHFWMAPRPYIERIVFRRYHDLNTVQAAFEVGDIDWINLLPDMVERTRSLMADRATFREIPRHGYDFMTINLEHPILRDRRVRQALKFGLDRQTMLNSILDGRGVVVHAHQIPTSWATGAPNLNTYAFNPTRARELLDEAGWRTPPSQTLRRRAGAPDGELLRITINWSPPGNLMRSEAAAMAVRQWRELGVDASAMPIESAMFLSRLQHGQYDIAVTGWGGISIDPDPSFAFHSEQAARGGAGRIRGLNFPRFRHADVDRLLEAGRLTVDMSERRMIYQRVDRILNLELPYIWLWQHTSVRGVSNRIGGIAETPIGTAFGEAMFIRDLRR